MKLGDQLVDYVNAAFSGLWVLTREPDEAEREIACIARERNWALAVWDVARGLRVAETEAARADGGAGDPLAPLRALPALARAGGTALLILHNYHRFVASPEVVQTVFGQLIAGKSQRTFVVILAPVAHLPPELEKVFVVLEHQLPDREQLLGIARELTADAPNDLPLGDHLDQVLDAAAGLTRYEAEGAFALSLARHGQLRADSLWDLKAQTLRKSAVLSLFRGEHGFDRLGGLAALKDFCRRALRPGRRVTARGVLLLGVPGTGKSAFARALGAETGRPTLVLDVGSVYGSLVGQTEATLRQALRVIDAMAPAVVFIDEIEKALAGAGGHGDSGVATRLFGTFLSWLSDRESDTFVIGTCNDISKLPPEFARAERWDAVYFVDLPNAADRDAIWALYRATFGISDSQARPDDSGWTGAEIRACCRLAALLDVTLTQAAHHVVPVAVTAAEQVDRLRTWASGRCLNAAAPGLYVRNPAAPAVSPSRRVRRNPTDN